ncbi:MAG TPA: GGDEF-domain containing protein, partial [Afipia sp.]
MTAAQTPNVGLTMTADEDNVLPPSAPSILEALGHATFVWDIAGDSLHWSDNAGDVLRNFPRDALSKASDFAKLIEPKRAARSDAVMNTSAKDEGSGVLYQIEYGLRAAASAPIVWVEESGRWFA